MQPPEAVGTGHEILRGFTQSFTPPSKSSSFKWLLAFSEKSHLDVIFDKSKGSSCNIAIGRCLIVLLLLMSGNVQPNPELQYIQTPTDCKSLSGLNIVDLNVRSLLSKMDLIRMC